MFRIIMLLLSLINPAVLNASYPGIYIEEQITTTIPNKMFHGIKKTYLTKDKALIIDPTLPSRIVFDFIKEKVYLINEVKKTLSTHELNAFAMPVNENIYSEFMQLKDSDFFWKESGNKKKIGNHNCFELVVYIPRIAALARIWLSNEVETELASHFPFFKNNLDVLHKKIMSLFEKKNSYIVESVTMIVRPNEAERYLKTQLLKISNQGIPQELFDLPVDYTKVK